MTKIREIFIQSKGNYIYGNFNFPETKRNENIKGFKSYNLLDCKIFINSKDMNI